MKHDTPRTLLAAFTALALGGCAGGVIGPEGAQSNAFLDKVSASCGKLSVGNQPINYLLDVNSNDAYFVDEVSKLSAGEIDRATFADDINGFYPTGANQPAIDCIVAQLEGS